MRIAEFSKVTGLSRDTIRYYEKRGLLKPAIGANEYREFDEVSVERAHGIKTAQALGFSLREIGEILESWDAADLTNEAKRRYVTEKIGQIEAQIARLESMKGYLVRKVEWMDGGEIGPPPPFPTGHDVTC